MKHSTFSNPTDEAAAHLDNPNTCALYLTDALETGRSTVIAEVLRDIQVATTNDSIPVDMSYNLRLIDVIDILNCAGLRLVAEPIADKTDERGSVTSMPSV